MSNKIEKPIKISPASMNRLLQQSNVQALIDAAIAAIPCPYDIGDIYKTVNPAYNTAAKVAARWPGTTWEQWAKGRVPLGMGYNGVTNYITLGSQGGAEKVSLTSSENGTHTHTFTGSAVNTGNQSASHNHAFTGSAVTSGGESAGHVHTQSNHQHTVKHRSDAGGAGVAWGFDAAYGESRFETSNTQSDGGGGNTGWNNVGHTHSVTAAGTLGNQSASHTHSVSAAGTNANSGSGTAHENRMPYETCYMWKRLT